MKSLVKNTKFDNLVNYPTQESSYANFLLSVQSSSDPTSLAYLTQNSQLVEYRLVGEASNDVGNEEKVPSQDI